MYGWWNKTTTRIERRLMRRRAAPMLAPLPTWLVLGLGAALLLGFVVLLLRSHRVIAGFSICLLMVCFILAISKLRRYVDWLKRQEKKEHTHHGEFGVKPDHTDNLK
jgi:hypothetical protein